MGTGNLLWVLMLIVMFSSFLTAIGNLALLSWTKDLVPTRKLSDLHSLDIYGYQLF